MDKLAELFDGLGTAKGLEDLDVGIEIGSSVHPDSPAKKARLFAAVF